MKMRIYFTQCLVTAICLHGLSTLAFADANALDKVEVYPKEVHLKSKGDRQSFVVQATDQSGLTTDVTKECKVELADGNLARIENFTVYPVADGQTEMHLEYQGQKLTVPVAVAEATIQKPISFKQDVMAVFMKKGCNMGSCHGAARGKDGFRLSLFGFDPDTDYESLTHEISTRRLNLAIPENSLMIQKSDGSVSHTGGQLMKKDDEYYNILVGWIKAGCPRDPGEVPTVTKVDLFLPVV